MKAHTPHFLRLLIVAVALSASLRAYPQGSLTPPGPPGPTMKALDQIASTGIPIDAKHVTATDANYEFVISQAGNYFLTRNLDVSKPEGGIRVAAAGVTIDLNGFAIGRGIGSTVGGAGGISIAATAHRCVVKNGSISGGFNYGVFTALGAKGGAFQQLTVSGCGNGLLAGQAWLVESCIAHDNSFVGISSTGEGGTFSNCIAYKNGGTGIYAPETTTVMNCTSSSNTSVGGNGVAAAFGSSLINCTASYNQGDGIVAAGNCLILNNSSYGNGANGTGAGIRLDGSGNRVESNNVTENDYGVKANAAGNLIIKNSSRGNPTAFSLVAGNSVGDIVNVWNNGAGATITTSNPWANLLY